MFWGFEYRHQFDLLWQAHFKIHASLLKRVDWFTGGKTKGKAKNRNQVVPQVA